MSDEVENGEAGFLDLLTNPSKALANWYVGLGVWGLFLAILNIAGVLHPTYRISWGGLLTFELWDSWQGTDQSFYVTAGDGIFMINASEGFMKDGPKTACERWICIAL